MILWEVGFLGSGQFKRLEVGELTDGASVWWVLSWLIPAVDHASFPACGFHDKQWRWRLMMKHLGATPTMTRRQIDQEFLEMLLARRVPRWKAMLMYAGVRAQAWWTRDV